MKILYTISIGIIMILLSCNKETHETLPQTEPLIKRKLLFNSIEETTPRFTLDYEYDLNKNLIRTISSINRVDLFKYDYHNLLVNKLGYEQNYYKKNVLVDSVISQYVGRLLIKELYYDPGNGAMKSSIRYEYENSKLTRKYVFSYQTIVSITLYEYSGDLCTKETCYNDSVGSKFGIYQYHHYKNKKLTDTEIYGLSKNIIQLILYTYDAEGKLITEEAMDPNPNSVNPYFYVYRYEYE